MSGPSFRSNDNFAASFDELGRLVLDVFHGAAYVLKQLDRWALLVKSVVLLHDVTDLLHDTVQLQCHTDSLGNVGSVLDAHAKQLGNLVKSALVSLADLPVSLLVDELDDAVWLALLGRLASLCISIDRPDHKVLHVADLGLVIDLIDESRLLLSIITHVEVSAHKDLA